MLRFEVIPRKYWRNIGNGKTASIYGACPWASETDKQNWKVESGGWTIRDNETGTIGQAFGLRSINRNILEDVQSLADKLNKREST